LLDAAIVKWSNDELFRRKLQYFMDSISYINDGLLATNPIEFHTATLIGTYIYVIGSLGYRGTCRFGETPVYRLDVSTFQMEPLEKMGDLFRRPRDTDQWR